MSVLWRGEDDIKRGDTGQTVHQAAVREDMMDLINIQKKKCFHINVQLYTCVLGVIKLIIVIIFARHENTKHVISQQSKLDLYLKDPIIQFNQSTHQFIKEVSY